MKAIFKRAAPCAADAMNLPVVDPDDPVWEKIKWDDAGPSDADQRLRNEQKKAVAGP